MNVQQAIHDSPLGPLWLEVSAAGVQRVAFDPPAGGPASAPAGNQALLDAVRRQLDAYFSGRLRRFELPLAALGTPFQQRVWHALCGIDHGRTCSYRDIAQRIGAPAAVRAVGAANGRNPIAIVVPCHRVIGADGSLTGYAGGLERKQKLLVLEAACRPVAP
jgi:methylated-DNA-[protein]-cysteine S-methyltransferase